ncbi:MAG: NAD(P)-dependent alcohol dehydrogenase [Gammaproteobacteria bacterium]|nr:NAD(P)-dependent alcohol dehydrogenase [Gammaproteobacteria bacterium]
MTAVLYNCYGGPEVLQTTTVAKPVPADNEVLVKVRAAAVNPLDWHFMRGSPYLMRLMSGLGKPEDERMGVDFAGVVESVGKDVTRYAPGDEVFGGRSGAFAEYLLIPEDRGMAHKPANVTFEQAATVAIAGVTAIEALRDKGQVKPGDKVLINGASGGVGTFAVQLAKAMGAEVSGVCSTRNVELVTSLGADRVYDYTRENYTEGDEKFDVIVDMVGNHPHLDNLGVLESDGILVMVGGAKGDWVAPLKGPLKAMMLGPFVDQEMITLLAGMDAEELAELGEYMAAGDMTPVIDQRFSFAEIEDAIRYSETGRARGKIVVTME